MELNHDNPNGEIDLASKLKPIQDRNLKICENYIQK